MRTTIRAIAVLGAIALAGVSARADFTPIAQPTASYTSSTTLVDITGIPDGTSGITSVSQGAQTISFDQSVTKTTVGVGWQTWGSPPNTESSTPPVLYRTFTNSLTLTLSVPSTTFGLELQGNEFVLSQFLVIFLDEALNPVGNVNLQVSGGGGALLFAASTTTSPFARVVINDTTQNASGFAIAQLRFIPVPEPASVAMIAQALAAVGFYGWRKRRQMAAKI